MRLTDEIKVIIAFYACLIHDLGLNWVKKTMSAPL